MQISIDLPKVKVKKKFRRPCLEYRYIQSLSILWNGIFH